MTEEVGRMTLSEFCERTSLHGWRYIFGDKSPWKYCWIAIVIGSNIIAGFFIFYATSDFTKSTVVTTIHSTTVPLSEVFFPAVTVCNINQVRKSFFTELGINNNMEIIKLLYEQYYNGSDRVLTEKEEAYVKSLFTSEAYVKNEFHYHSVTKKDIFDHKTNWTLYLERFREFIEKGAQFTRLAVQEPWGVMILQASFGNIKMDGASTDFNPYFGTDYGICSIIKPQTAFDPTLEGLPYWNKVFGKINWAIQKGAQVGKANGLSMLLDTESFDYTFHLKAGEGFKIAIHHHLDQPIMSIKELDISPGSVFQIAVTPTLLSTSESAIKRFHPKERGCYTEGELPLKYLPSKLYRYEMSNCLFEAAYEEILEQCNCTPSFHALGYKEKPRICSGPGLTCMNRIIMGIGNYNRVGPNKDECLAACEDQTNSVSVTSSSFPNSETFVRREEFCLVVKKLERTCKSMKYEMIVKKFPKLCEAIKSVQDGLAEQDKKKFCQNHKWDPSSLGFNSSDKRILELEKALFDYSKHNLAVVNIYIKEPVVTRILRDQKIPIISFVANTGGLLGLCMGFSLVSLFEIIYHVIGIILKRKTMNCAFTFKQVSKEQQQQQLSNQQTDVSALASDDRRYTASNGRCFNLVDKDLSSATSPLSTIHSAAPGIGVGDDDGIGVNGGV